MQVTPLFTKICFKDSKNTSGNGHCVIVLFIIPVIIDVHGHRFEIYTLVSKILENVENEVILKPNKQKLIKVKAPFIDEISGMGIIKILDRGT